VGFVDAEGNFQVYPKKRVLKSGEISKYNVGLGFHISLHSRDLNIINTISQNLNNLGTIYTYKNKPDTRIAINDRRGLESLVEVLEYFPLVTEHQLSRYLLLKEYLKRDIREFKTMEEYSKYNEELFLSIKATIPKNNGLDFNQESFIQD